MRGGACLLMLWCNCMWLSISPAATCMIMSITCNVDAIETAVRSYTNLESHDFAAIQCDLQQQIAPTMLAAAQCVGQQLSTLQAAATTNTTATMHGGGTVAMDFLGQEVVKLTRFHINACAAVDTANSS
eukprot:m.125464 g.125464  ORF g.125464 m.125464 type:complete len:129 (-) comp11166_c0_seq4:193-579(-)